MFWAPSHHKEVLCSPGDSTPLPKGNPDFPLPGEQRCPTDKEQHRDRKRVERIFLFFFFSSLSCPQQVPVLIHSSASHGCLAMQPPSPCSPHLRAVPEARTSPARERTGPRKATSFDEDLSNLFDLTSLTKGPFKEDELFHVAAISHVNQKDFFFLTATTLYPFPTKLFILIQLSSSLQ